MLNPNTPVWNKVSTFKKITLLFTSQFNKPLFLPVQDLCELMLIVQATAGPFVLQYTSFVFLSLARNTIQTNDLPLFSTIKIHNKYLPCQGRSRVLTYQPSLVGVRIFSRIRQYEAVLMYQFTKENTCDEIHVYKQSCL